ncbi:hypothetical protein CUPL110328_22090 [Cupriavidus plantarum]|nr:hypothetical protein LMG26296_03758 [Cupriavidus plantarum]SMR86749.1 hypothetical protein SAMN05421735_5591 [Cupriavidus plantarum]
MNQKSKSASLTPLYVSFQGSLVYETMPKVTRVFNVGVQQFGSGELLGTHSNAFKVSPLTF